MLHCRKAVLSVVNHHPEQDDVVVSFRLRACCGQLVGNLFEVQKPAEYGRAGGCTGVLGGAWFSVYKNRLAFCFQGGCVLFQSRAVFRREFLQAHRLV